MVQTFRGGVLEIPVSTVGSREAAYFIPATVHHKPLMNGASGFDTPDHRVLAAAFASQPIAPSTMTLLEQLRCTVLVVHGDDPAARSSATRTWLRENLAAGRLHFVGRFDRGMRGDYAFVLPAVDAGAIRDVPTRSSLEALSRFLEADAPSYNPSAVETLDTPHPGESVAGPLRIAGWAVAPHGVREVRLHLQNDSLVVKATCGSRIDVNRYLPWYPEGCGAGFEATVAQRPTGVLQTTDVVVEVIGEDGTSKHFPPVFFRWFRSARK